MSNCCGQSHRVVSARLSEPAVDPPQPARITTACKSSHPLPWGKINPEARCSIELFIIRHAESGNNSLGDNRARVVDPSITDLGQRQAAILAQHLATGSTQDLIPGAAPGSARAVPRKGYGITSLYCSPMLRSLQTAHPIKEALGLIPKVWVDIHERGGMFLEPGEDQESVGHPGMTRPEILAKYPDYQLPPGITGEGWWNRGREDPATAAGRAIRVAEDLAAMSGTEERVAIITHGAFMNILFKALLDQLPGNHIYYRHNNTGISRVSIRKGSATEVISLNRLDHLPSDLVS